MIKKRGKVPIGVLDKKYFDKFTQEDIECNGGMCLREIKFNRLISLKEAIKRYAEADLPINTEWVYEYNFLLKEMGVLDIQFTLK